MVIMQSQVQKDAAEAASAPGKIRQKVSAPPIDMVHLARQSLGDSDLEAEILQMFRCQSKVYLHRYRDADSSKDRHHAAHTILGSARAIGAWAVADAAKPLDASPDRRVDSALLEEAIGEANSYIDGLIGEGTLEKPQLNG